MKPGILFIIILITLTTICDTISQLFLKSCINSLDINVNSLKKILRLVYAIIKIPRAWAGFAFSTISLLIWLFALTKAELNFAFSIDSMHYIFIALGSMIILKEKVSTTRWMGIILIIIGISLVTIS